jgi:hypothetical protein
MDVIHGNADTLGCDDLVLSGRLPAAARSVGPPSAEKDSHDRLQSGQSYNRVTASGNSRLHAGNVYNNYYHVEPSMPRFVSTHPEGSRYLETFRRCLGFEQMETRLASIATAHPYTCEWIVDCPQYKRWRDPSLMADHHGCLWIKGKPGAGKSTIMKSLLSYAKVAKPGGKVVSFFFNARGSPLERSIEGMYRSLLYQMAIDLPSPLTNLRTETVELYGSKEWPLELLKDLCRKAVRYLTNETTLTFFIDALDEGDVEDDVRDMISFVEELATEASENGRTLSICLASRHYPTISMCRIEKLILDNLKDHDEDITTYVRAQLRIKSTALQAKLVTSVGVKAHGVFLWVVLVVKILNKEADRGNQHLLEAKLHELPNGLHDLFDAILERDSEHDPRLLPALIWVLFAKCSLEPIELFFAIMVSAGQLGCDNIVWDPALVDHNLLADFLLSSSKGLLEPIKFGSTATHKVQIIHESVREYLLHYGLRKLDEDLSLQTAAQCHGRLARWCSKYIQLTVTHELFGHNEQARSMRQCPLLEYAVQHTLPHAELAAKQGYRQILYAEAPFETWHLIAGDRRCTTMLHLLVVERLPNLVDMELARAATLDSDERQRYLDASYRDTDEVNRAHATGNCTALEMAISMGNIVMTRALLAAGADVSLCCERHGHPLKVAQNCFICRIDTDILEPLLAERERAELVELLLEKGAKPPSGFNTSLETANPLLKAVVGTEDWVMVDRLLRHRPFMAAFASEKKSDWESLMALLWQGAQMGLRNWTKATYRDITCRWLNSIDCNEWRSGTLLMEDIYHYLTLDNEAGGMESAS